MRLRLYKTSRLGQTKTDCFRAGRAIGRVRSSVRAVDQFVNRGLPAIAISFARETKGQARVLASLEIFGKGFKKKVRELAGSASSMEKKIFKRKSIGPDVERAKTLVFELTRITGGACSLFE